MSNYARSLASLHLQDLETLSAAIASANMPLALFGSIETVATERMGCSIFSAAKCLPEAFELERIYSSRPDIYPVGARKSKRLTSWGRSVLENRQVYVGEGPLEMAAAFDDQERMASLGVRSIVNVPVVLRDQVVGVLNFARAELRVGADEIAVGRLLGIVATVAFTE